MDRQMLQHGVQQEADCISVIQLYEKLILFSAAVEHAQLFENLQLYPRDGFKYRSIIPGSIMVSRLEPSASH
jgi:hypothetical protein